MKTGATVRFVMAAITFAIGVKNIWKQARIGHLSDWSVMASAQCFLP